MSNEDNQNENNQESIDDLIDKVELPEDETIEEEEAEEELDDLENEKENLEELDEEIELESKKEEKPDNLVKHLRSELKERNKQLRERDKRLKAYEEKKKALAELPPKPSLDDEDIDFDSELYDEKLLEWNELKRKHEKKANEEKQQQEELQKSHEEKVKAYRESMDSLPYEDAEDAEDTAKMFLNETQQALILEATDDPAKMIYAIGTNEKLAEQLAEVTNPVQFIAKVAKLETRLSSTMKKKPKPSANSRVKGGNVSRGSSDEVLDKLREEAAKTGDFTKVRQYKKRVAEAKANQG